MVETWLPNDGTAQILLSLALMWAAGFLMTRLTKLIRLPNAAGYILAGVALGLLHLIPPSLADRMAFVGDIAISFMAFGAGRYLRLGRLKKGGRKVWVITVLESLFAWALVTAATHLWLGLPLPFALLLGTIGAATAPASSLMRIDQYHAKGDFVDTLLQVVALDDGVAVALFTLCAAVAGRDNWAMSLFKNGVALATGVGLGLLLSALINKGRSKDHRLVLACACVVGQAALCQAMGIFPLLSLLVMGAVYANAHQDKSLFKGLNRMTPPILLMFFVLAGMALRPAALAGSAIAVAVYFVARPLGKGLGAYLGALVARYPNNVRRYLGLALFPQAGLSIAMAVLAARLLPEQQGQLLVSIVLAASIAYELMGQIGAKAALILSGSTGQEAAGALPGQKLVSRWQQRERLGKHEDWVYVAGQSGPVYARDDEVDLDLDGSFMQPTLAEEYMDSLSEVEQPPLAARPPRDQSVGQ